MVKQFVLPTRQSVEPLTEPTASPREVVELPYREVLPAKLSQLITSLLENCGLPAEFVFFAMLVAAAAAFGNTARVALKKTFKVSCNIFVVIVAPPGSNKSAPLKLMLTPLYRRQATHIHEYRQQKVAYEEYQAMAKEEREVVDVVTRPSMTTIVLKDYTLESLYLAMDFNPRGVVVYADEIMGLFSNLNRYNNGSDIEAYLDIWSGTPLLINRKGSDPINIEYPNCSLLGGVQTKRLKAIFSGVRGENGLVDRIDFVMPEGLGVSAWNDAEADLELLQYYYDCIDRLLDRPLIENTIGDKSELTELPFSPEARKRLMLWRNDDYMSRAQDAVGSSSETAVIKNDIKLLKYSGVLQMLYWTTGEGNDQEISVRAVEGAIQIINYLQNNTERVFRLVCDDDVRFLMSQLQQAVYDSLPETFKTSEGVKVAALHSMAKRTFSRFVANKDFFTSVEYGIYKKNYNQ